MSSTEPPSRTSPRGQSGSHETTKAARDELVSKGKVEKVREVDADESRKRKFLKFYEEDQTADTKTERRPSPFELYSGQKSAPSSGLGGRVEDAIVASSSYVPSPDVSSSLGLGSEEESARELPQSEDFWEDVDFPPDRPSPPRSFRETPESRDKHLLPEAREEKKKRESPVPHELGKAEKKKESSSFGVPGKPKKEKGTAAMPFEEGAAAIQPKPVEKKEPLGEEKAAVSKAGRALEKEEERYLEPLGKGVKEKEKKKKEEALPYREPEAVPFKPVEEREGRRGKEAQKTIEIEAPSLPPLPPHIQPLAAAAATQATPYIHPSTVSLFFQMVGTMYVMSSPPGINRTEIVLNNPSYANSKFFGSTIRIEKYATAPDSFNITLTGSDEAVTSFKENVPSLMAAFQNGNFTFRVNRLDVEYTMERPVYRRKEKGEEKGEPGGGGLGERRK